MIPDLRKVNAPPVDLRHREWLLGRCIMVVDPVNHGHSVTMPRRPVASKRAHRKTCHV